jgi:Flp pilus assembly protein TadD
MSTPVPKLALAALVIFAAVLLAAPTAFGASADAPPAINNADYDLGADAVKAKDWERAVHHLAIAAQAEPANADVQNLLGYAYRNQRKFELAFTHYANALKLDPNHRGAHEYVGEAYVLTGNRAKAQEHLAALERICGRGCEEYQDLARALAAPR